MKYLWIALLAITLGCYYNAVVQVNPLMEVEIHEGYEVIDTSLFDARATPRIEYLIIHCTANTAGTYYSPAQAQRDWNRRGFNGVPGYHWMIQPNGHTDTLRPINTDAYLTLKEVVYSARGYNNRALAVSYVGGTIRQDGMFLATDTRTPAQKTEIARIVREIRQRYPWIKVVGHQNLTTKACPSFDARTEYKDF